MISWKIARRLRQSCTRTAIPSGQEREKKTETGKQLDYYLKVYVEEGTDKAELYKATSGKTKVTAKKVTDKMSAEIGDKA